MDGKNMQKKQKVVGVPLLPLMPKTQTNTTLLLTLSLTLTNASTVYLLSQMFQ